jgi:hypothetical protein
LLAVIACGTRPGFHWLGSRARRARARHPSGSRRWVILEDPFPAPGAAAPQKTVGTRSCPIHWPSFASGTTVKQVPGFRPSRPGQSVSGSRPRRTRLQCPVRMRRCRAPVFSFGARLTLREDRRRRHQSGLVAPSQSILGLAVSVLHASPLHPKALVISNPASSRIM